MTSPGPPRADDESVAPTDPFRIDPAGLRRAVELLVVADRREAGHEPAMALPPSLPEVGRGGHDTLEVLAPAVLGAARALGAPGYFAHMDPPTPWITWATQMWTASRNQNLLHPDTAPQARQIEATVVAWLAPWFGMTGGHMTPGSTVANLTALWAARQAGAHTVVATAQAHVSVAKAAHLLAMTHRVVGHWGEPGDLDGCAVVITAGATSTGDIEALDAAPGALWRHVDAAWAGPLVLSDQHRGLLAGIERADSVAVSAHKWLFQPKESALVLFADVDRAHRSVSFGADYLAVPNVGVLGSHGATAVPLLATLLAYGRRGVADWIDHSMRLAEELADLVETHPELELRARPSAGVLNWRHVAATPKAVQACLVPEVFVSTTTVRGEPWLRSVAANPMADPHLVVDAVIAAARRAAGSNSVAP